MTTAPKVKTITADYEVGKLSASQSGDITCIVRKGTVKKICSADSPAPDNFEIDNNIEKV